MKERLYLFLGLFFVTIPAFAVEAATALLVSAGISALSGIVGGVSAAGARRRAERREAAAAARRRVLEANRQDIPDFAADIVNPYANLQIATRGAEIQAEQADISLASTLDTLRATGASAGGATALARAAAQSKRKVAADIEKQEAKAAELRGKGELQAAQLRQRGQIYSTKMQEERDLQRLDREASLESSFSQQAASYGAQSSQLIGQAVGTVGTVVAGGVIGEGSFLENLQKNFNLTES